jgi:hydroxymethylglutaryl-CoA lyase
MKKPQLLTSLFVKRYVSCIFVCPFDGPTTPGKVLRVATALLDMGCFEISLGDTLGAGTPADVQRLLEVLFKTIPASKLAGHFHDTYGQAVANVVTAYNLGVRAFDSSVGGLGGCPYSPGSKGNLATEDIVYMFENMGISTGVNLEKLAEIGYWINNHLETVNGSRAGAAIISKRRNRQPGTCVGKKGLPAENLGQKLITPSGTGVKRYGFINDNEEYQLFRNGSTIKIVLNRPQNGNALTRAMLRNLTSLFRNLSKDKSIFHVILTSKGKYFCTGMDLGSEGVTGTDSGSLAKKAQFEGLYQLFEAIDKTSQTTIALVNGPAFGGGVGLAFVCDIRLARPDVTFTMTEVKYGLCPATISKFVTREWGPSMAREAMLTARSVTAQELGRIGAVHGVAASATPQALEELLSQYTNQYLRHAAPEASAKTKELVAAAWRYSGDATQDKIIKDVFEWMIAPCDEARVGTANFQAGNKYVDWDEIYAQKLQMGDPKPRL